VRAVAAVALGEKEDWLSRSELGSRRSTLLTRLTIHQFTWGQSGVETR